MPLQAPAPRKPLVNTIIRAPRGTRRQEVPIEQVTVPDLWHLAEHLEAEGKHSTAVMVLECWHLAHDLLANLRGETGKD